jgi:hypothetical protein
MAEAAVTAHNAWGTWRPSCRTGARTPGARGQQYHRRPGEPTLDTSPFPGRKKSIFPPLILTKSVFTLSTLKPDKPPPSTFQTVHFTSHGRVATVNGMLQCPVVCYSVLVFVFSFKFILAESLKNHSKSQKNHEIENPILLHST